ncbi:MAG: hypothetical protein M3270_01585 [Thermoproteota archaeon]|nr:hypothetical protein [Thermoproteota archaeon]
MAFEKLVRLMITSVSRASESLPSERLVPERVAEEKLACERSASERLAFDRNAAFQEEENVLVGPSLDTLLEQI